MTTESKILWWDTFCHLSEGPWGRNLLFIWLWSYIRVHTWRWLMDFDENFTKAPVHVFDTVWETWKSKSKCNAMRIISFCLVYTFIIAMFGVVYIFTILRHQPLQLKVLQKSSYSLLTMPWMHLMADFNFLPSLHIFWGIKKRSYIVNLDLIDNLILLQVVKLFAIAPFDQILTIDGRKLEGDEKSLAELKLYPDCLILLQVCI